MATKKPATGKTVVKWDEELARRAAIASKMEENSLGMGSSIGTKGGILVYRDNPIPGNKVNVVVLDHAFLNAWYLERFDPDNPAPPDCFSLQKAGDDPGKAEKLMKPHEKSTDPQSDKCSICPKNEWGSADTGRGKACSNNRRLVLITEDGLEDPANAQIVTIKVPTTSVKMWAGYVSNIADVKKRPPLGVVTEISLVPHAKHQFEMHFKLVREVDGDIIGAIIDKADEKATQDVLMAPFQPKDDEKPARGAKTRGGKAPAAKARR